MRLGLYLSAAMAVSVPALADESSFPVDYSTCIGAIRTAAEQLHLPLKFTVLNANVAVFNIATDGGLVTMRCSRMSGTLTVTTPPGQSILPYIGGGDGG